MGLGFGASGLGFRVYQGLGLCVRHGGTESQAPSPSVEAVSVVGSPRDSNIPYLENIYLKL